jgi:holo-[acyl-carrier protein] synthase
MIGIDIEEIERFTKILKNKPTTLKRAFTVYEWQYASKKNTAQTLAGIWCAKEAVVKAFSEVKSIFITDIHIEHFSNGAPFIASIKKFDFEKEYYIKISISHTKLYAVANCVILKNNMN